MCVVIVVFYILQKASSRPQFNFHYNLPLLFLFPFQAVFFFFFFPLSGSMLIGFLWLYFFVFFCFSCLSSLLIFDVISFFPLHCVRWNE